MTITESHPSNKTMGYENTHVPKTTSSRLPYSFTHSVFMFGKYIIKYCGLVHKLPNKNILFTLSELPLVPLYLVFLLTKTFFILAWSKSRPYFFHS